MSRPDNVQPHRVFTRYIPDQTSADDLRPFFMNCGNVTMISMVPLKDKDLSRPNPYLCGFIKYETQEGADRAVKELNGKIFVNKKGIAGVISVTYAVVDHNTRQNMKDNDQKNWHIDINDLWQKYQANEEKLRQIFHDPATDQELNDLKMKMSQLETKKEELEAKLQTARGENEILKLKLKLVELDVEQMKLKGGNV